MRRDAPGVFVLTLDDLPAETPLRYRYRVHRVDTNRWITVTDPRAWQLDASPDRWALRFVGQGAPKKPRPLRRRVALADQVIYELCPREVVPRDTLYANLHTTRSRPAVGEVFRHITAQIRSGYYNRLGITTLELMPILASGWQAQKKRNRQKNAATSQRRPPRRTPWGYQALSWYAVNGDFGTAADLTRLIDAAHARGLAVLADFSLEHGYGGKLHGLVTDLWPAWRVAHPQNPWGLLELNLDDAAARRFVLGALRRLLVDLGFDGLRLDWTEKLPTSRWKSILAAVRRFAPTALLISENPGLPLVTEAGFDATWDFFFQWEAPLLLRRVYRNWDGVQKRLVDTQDKLVENLRARAYPPTGARAIAGLDVHASPPVIRYLESHDLPRLARPRVPWQHGGDRLLDVDGDGKTPDWIAHGSPAISRLGATLLFTLPGAIMIFQGQEVGAKDALTWDYDPLSPRRDLATLARYRKLLHLRATHRALRSNDLRILLSDSARHVLAYSRGIDPKRRDDDRFVVVLNFADKALHGIALRLPQGGIWIDLLSGRHYRGPTCHIDLPVAGSALLMRRP